MIMSSLVQQLISYPLAFVWIGVGVFLFIRTRVLQNAYIRRFTHINYDPFFVVASLRDYITIHHIMHDPQPDAELEQMRREIWRRLRYYLVWIFGFPVLVFGVAALLIGTGLVRPQ